MMLAVAPYIVALTPSSMHQVLIDGRARADCARYILPYLKPSSIVFIHDYMPRPYYHDVIHQLYNRKGLVLDGQSLLIATPKEAALITL